MSVHRNLLTGTVCLMLLAGLAWLAFRTIHGDDEVAAIQEEIARIRGRPFKHAVAVQYVTREQRPGLTELSRKRIQGLLRASEGVPPSVSERSRR